jgi:hypothetical protein
MLTSILYERNKLNCYPPFFLFRCHNNELFSSLPKNLKINNKFFKIPIKEKCKKQDYLDDSYVFVENVKK